MPSIILYIARSLDGYIATKDGSVSWLDPFNTIDYGYNEFLKPIDTVIMGSKTYEQILSFGEYPYSGKTTVVYTKRHLPKPKNTEITFLSTFTESYWRSLPAETNVWLIGGATIIRSFIQKNLITQFSLFTMPVILGSGIPLFLETETQTQNLVHIRTITYKNGVTLTQYNAQSEQ